MKESKMSGFFSGAEIAKKDRLSSHTGCAACGRYKVAKNPKMKPYGFGEKGILIIGSSPSYGEDNKNQQMFGRPAQILERALRRHGIDLERDCIKINALQCYIGNDEQKTMDFVPYCRPFVWRTIKEMNPKLILLMGSSAVASFLGHSWGGKLDSIIKWRGMIIPDRESNCWVCPVMHPSSLIKNEKDKAYETIFKLDIKKALETLNVPMPKLIDDEKCIHFPNDKELYSLLRKLNKSEVSEIAIDFETTGLKPHMKGHEIVSCAIAEEPDFCYAFETPKNPRILGLLKEVLKNPAVKKIAANMKFEDTWSRVFLNTEIQGWVWDTMLAAHVIDNRRLISGLKFQVYVNFGIVQYNQYVEQYLKSKDDSLGGNAFNSIHLIHKKDLLLYNGKDSLYELRLAHIQRLLLT